MGLSLLLAVRQSHLFACSVGLLCSIAAELESEVVPIVLQLAKSEMSDDFRSEAAGVSIYSIFT